LLNHPTLDRLRELGLDGMAKGFRDLADQPNLEKVEESKPTHEQPSDSTHAFDTSHGLRALLQEKFITSESARSGADGWEGAAAGRRQDTISYLAFQNGTTPRVVIGTQPSVGPSGCGRKTQMNLPIEALAIMLLAWIKHL
jgi:hypothetical protein